MNTTTRRVAALTATVITAGILAACGGQGKFGGEAPGSNSAQDAADAAGADSEFFDAQGDEADPVAPLDAKYNHRTDLPDGLGAITVSEPVESKVFTEDGATVEGV